MTNVDELMREVRAAIDEALSAGDVRTSWLQKQIVHAHIEMGHVPCEWTLCCAHVAVRDAILRVMRERRRCDEEHDTQQTLGFDRIMPGFERLRRSCLITRNGESMIVRTEKASDEELLTKAREHRKQGLGHLKTADEYERYVDSRKESRLSV